MQGWSVEAAVIALAGVSLAVGLWWCYFTIPFGAALHHGSGRAMAFGFGHLVLYASIAATGAGLHAAAYLLEDHSELDAPQTVLTIAVPVAVFVLALSSSSTLTLPRSRPAARVAARRDPGGAGPGRTPWLRRVRRMSAALTVLMLAPWVTVVGYELRGHRHIARLVAAMEADDVAR